MFTYIKLENFLSFGNITFDFKKNSSEVKHFAAIYGENGSGKTNFVRSIELIHNMLSSFDNVKRAEFILNFIKDSKHHLPDAYLQKIMRDIDIEHYISSCRTIDCDQPTTVEYGFILDGHEGFYRIEFEDKFTHESLYYFTGKQRGYLFDISINKSGNVSYKFYKSLFCNTKIKGEMIDEIKKYWGKHTFLSIVLKQMREINPNYIKENISSYLISFVHMLLNTAVISNNDDIIDVLAGSPKPYNLIRSLSTGRINQADMESLERSERIIRDILTQTYADIKDVSYEVNSDGDAETYYELYVDKMIAGKVRRISFENESTGTKKSLKIIRELLGLFFGVTIVYDEIDNGIHDILLKNIICSLPNEISGQLIFTTHNTVLLEEIDPHSAYVIQVDYLGNKEAHCMSDYSVKINNNLRIKYLKGLFGGTPYIDGIDYENIERELNIDKEAE